MIKLVWGREWQEGVADSAFVGTASEIERIVLGILFYLQFKTCEIQSRRHNLAKVDKMLLEVLETTLQCKQQCKPAGAVQMRFRHALDSETHIQD